jgi:predicted RNA binding protein YcfA (HicA-like mRNA interferase family)
LRRDGQRAEAVAEVEGMHFRRRKRHTKVIFGSKTARMPRHPSEEIKTGTLNAILKDLGIKR